MKPLIIDEFKSEIYIRPLDKTVVLIHGRAGSGKSTAAKIIREYSSPVGDVFAPKTEIIPFAQPLKEIAHKLGWNGQKTSKSRKFLQMFGTEVCRNILGEDIWINMWFKAAHESRADIVIVDDARFLNEMRSVMDNSKFYITLKLIGRTDGTTSAEHESEKELPDDLFTDIIVNDGDVAELTHKLTEVSNDRPFKDVR